MPISCVSVQQSSQTILMVAPTHFKLNEAAAKDNKFMNSPQKLRMDESVVQRRALDEFEGLVSALRDAGVDVYVFVPPPPEDDEQSTPDCVFPNNWFSTHNEPTGRTLVLYPMKVPNRRLERNLDVIASIAGEGMSVLQGDGTTLDKGDFQRRLDISALENEGVYLEGTGSMVLDRVNRIVYAVLSDRTNKSLLQVWADSMDYKPVAFSSVDSSGVAVYHTNVIMAVGTGWAVICAEGIHNEAERKQVANALSKHHEIVYITQKQVTAFCGNIIEVRDNHNRPLIAMSTQAYDAFTDDQKTTLRRHVHEIVHAPYTTIETIGGGGVRCSIAEIF